MSHSIFSSALGRAILRRPPSAPLLLRLTSTFGRHGPRESVHVSRAAAPSTAIDTPIDTTTTTTTTATTTTTTTSTTTPTPTPTTTHNPTTTADQCLPRRRKPPPEPCHRRPKTLLALLHLLDRAHDIPSRHRPGSKVDLSFHDPLSRARRRPRTRTRTRAQRKGRMSLKSITYEYLYHFHLLRPGAGGGGEAERVFSARVLDYLAERGYGAEDVVAWAWILLAGNVRQAVVRLDVWARLGGGGGGGGESGGLRGAVGEILGGCGSLGPLELELDRPSLRIPPFIILHNLRRPHSHIGAPTLRQLLPHVQASLRPRSGDTKTPLLLLIRLLRHARSSWPPAIPHVAKLMANLHPATAAPKRPARLTGTYNRLLALLSLPTHDRPFALMPLLQQSQFTLLRKMAALDIPITREGYRALIAVQLAHPKTAPEAQHVNSLSTLWPPYPVPKDGHRHSPGHPSSPRHLSRAATVLQQMAAAGYHNLGWEKEALVLAGTDTDNTPTIQTRTFHLAGRASARADPQNIWAVRVRATRTLDEAWCVFLDALAAVGVPPPPAWEELFVKVCAARKVSRQQTRHQQRLHEIQAGHDATRAATAETLRAVEQWDVVNRDVGERAKRVLPGDAREVAVWGSEGVHVPVKAPTVEELFAMMRRVCGRQAGVSVRLLAYLVREAETLEQGERLLTTWSAERFRRLLKTTAPTTGTRSSSSSTNDWPILTSYLTLLLRAPTPPRLSLSLRLLQAHTPRHAPAWNAVLSALCTTPPLATIAAARLALVWRLYTTMSTQRIQADANTLRLLCVAAERCPAGVDWGGDGPVDVAAGVVERSFGICEEGGAGGVPSLVAAEAAALHAYVRMLGFAGRTDKLEALVGWLRVGGGGVDVRSVVGRRVVVACAVFGVEDGGEWPGGWPGEEEVERYVVRGWRGAVERGEGEGEGEVEGVEGVEDVKEV